MVTDTIKPHNSLSWTTKIPPLAERLGVEPLEDDSGGLGSVTLICDAVEYDLFDLINAFLDKIDSNLDI